MKKYILYALVIFAGVNGYSQSTIYVSPKGSNLGSGTLKSPVQSIQQAIDKSRQHQGAVVIELMGGNYPVNKTIEVNRSDITIRAYKGQQVSVSGDVVIPVSKASKIKDKQTLSRLDKSVARKIYEIDFAKLGTTIEGMHAVGFGRPSKEGWSELVVNGDPLKMSRWPNEAMEPIGKVLVSGNDKDKEVGNLPVFKFKTDRVKRWAKADQVWLSGYFGYGYADDMIPVQKINYADSTFHMADFTNYQFNTGRPFLQWFAVNLLEEIDVPGEYAIDAKAQKIYFMPKGSIKEMRLLTLKAPIFAIENCKNVLISDVTIENARGIGVYIENAHNAVVDNCVIRNLGSAGVSMGKGNEPSDNKKLHNMANGGAQLSREIGAMGGALYMNPVMNRHAGTHNGVSNSYIYNTGAGGVILSGGDRMTLERGDSFVENCQIHDFNRIEKSYRPAVWIDGVGNRISGCDIYNAPSMAVIFHGNEHTIEYCKITNVCTEIDDQGAIYYGRDPSERGNVIRYNYFKELSPRHSVMATYHDDLACDGEVYGNIYYKAGYLPVMIGGGKDNHYYNNIFIGSPYAIHLDKRGNNWAKNMTLKGGIADQRLNMVNYTQPPYATAYPELVNYWKEGAELPLRNVFNGNLFFNIKNLINGETSLAEFYNNWDTPNDPGFVDATDPLKGFKENAEVYKKIKDFPKLPFDKIGCTLKNLTN